MNMMAEMRSTVVPVDLEAPPPALALPMERLQHWLEAARPGQRIEYHRGFLVLDRLRGWSPFGERQRRELGAVADRLLDLEANGRVHLVQLRHDDSDYGYFAVMSRQGGRRP